MMSSKIDCGDDDCAGSSNSGQLLREIEAISKALYLHSAPPNALLSPSDVRSHSAGKSRLSESKSKLNKHFFGDDLLHNDRKSSSVWNWKKPLKALAHIRHQKFNCFFSLHIHSIEGLPANFNDYSLRVHWKRKDEVSQTRPSKVFQGMVEFDETLVHRCSVYGGRSGPNHSAKYDPKLFLIYVSVIGVSGLDIGKHWVDLTRLLPTTLEELEGDKNSGKWTTSFKLSGKARGANLNVSFGFLAVRDDLVKFGGHLSVTKLLKLMHDRSSVSNNAEVFKSATANGMIRRVGSVSSSLNYESVISSSSVDEKLCHEAVLNSSLELSKSINFVYHKLDEEDIFSSAKSKFEFVGQFKQKPDVEFELSKEIDRDEYESTEFTVVECGIEVTNKENCRFEEFQSINSSVTEIISSELIIMDNDIAVDKKMDHNSENNIHCNYGDEFVADDCKCDKNTLLIKESTMEDMDSPSNQMCTALSSELQPPSAVGETLEKEQVIDTKSSYRESKKMVKESFSFDDVSESVVSDFLDMLGVEHGSFRFSDCDPQSPREHLLRQFEEEALFSGNSILYYDDLPDQEPDFGADHLPESGVEDYNESFDLSSIIQAAEEDHERVSQLRNRRKAKILEDLETEGLMREWGLNEKDFQYSPRFGSSGFGSPIELPPESGLNLPPLAEGIGSFIQMKGGGFLRSMNPAFFRNARNEGKLIIQVSGQLVLPAEMGSDFVEILQHLASIGSERLYIQTNKLMSLEDITGKTIQQVAWEAASSMLVLETERQSPLETRGSFGERKEFEEFPSGRIFNNLMSSFLNYETGRDIVTLEDLVPLAIDKIEVLSLEGLRIQSDMSDEAPSTISGDSITKMLSFGDRPTLSSKFLNSGRAEQLQPGDVQLMDLSITLDEWLRLDAGIISDENHDYDGIMKILAAHHAKLTELDRKLRRNMIQCEVSHRQQGLLGNNLMIALMVQLRDPLRNYEPVGIPMICLIQVERTFVRSMHEIDEDKFNLFKISGVHLMGVNSEPGKKHLWGTQTQRQSGSCWLLASGMGNNTIKLPSSKSMAIIKSSSSSTKLRHGNVLWSISSHVHNKEASWEEPNRNPDVILLD